MMEVVVAGGGPPIERVCVGSTALYTVAGDCTLRSTPLVPGEEKWSVNTKTWQSDLALCQDRILLSSGAMAGIVGAIKVWKGPQLTRSMTCDCGTIRCLLASSNFDLSAGSDDGSARLWDVETGAVRASHKLGNSSVRHMCRHRDVVAAGDESGTLWICDHRTQRVVSKTRPTNAIQGIASLQAFRLFSISRRAETSSPCQQHHVTEILEWDSRILERGSVRTVGFHGDKAIGLETCNDDLLVSASKDGGCAVWDKNNRLVAEFRVDRTVPTAFSVRGARACVVTSDRIARNYDTSNYLLPEQRIIRPCGPCSGTGVAVAGSKSVCMRCNATGRFLLDEPKVDEEKEEPVHVAEKDLKSEAVEEKSVEEMKTVPHMPNWLKRWLPQPSNDDEYPTIKLGGDRLEVGDLVVLAPTKQGKKTIFDRQGIPPALSGNEVGIVVQDDESSVPYQVRGPSQTTSWFEPWELSPCPKPPTPPPAQ